MEYELVLVNWNLIPTFVKEAVEDLPFKSTDEAQDFSDLMTSWMRSRLLQAPEMDESPANIDAYLDSIEAELVFAADPDVFQTDNPSLSASSGPICRQMLLCQLSDQETHFL